MSKAKRRRVRTRRRRLNAHTRHGENRHDKTAQYAAKMHRLAAAR